MSTKEKLLITGASGQLGQRVTHHLLETLGTPPEDLILLTRSPARLASAAGQGIEVRAADLDSDASVSTALSGATRVLVISTDAIGRRAEQHQRAFAAAKRAGADHLVYTSMPDPGRSKVSFAPEHSASEAAIRDSGVPGWTILRNHWYFENLHMTWPAIRASGKWFTAAGKGRAADVARDDLALAAATALKTGEGQSTFTLSGPAPLSVQEMASELNRVLGTSIEVVPVTGEQLIQGMVTQAGMPPPVAEMLASFDANTASGAVGTVTSDLETLTGRAPISFATWLTQNAESLKA